MKMLSHMFLGMILFGLPIHHVRGQEAEAKQVSKAKAPDRAALEKQFERAMTKATFAGRWCSVKDGKMGEERSEKYTIQSARKVGGDVWLIQARIQYGSKDVAVPIPVNVLWAGDTAVISINKLAIPNVGTYSARVLVHDNTYAGTWSGGDHGGLLNGLIQHDQP